MEKEQQRDVEDGVTESLLAHKSQTQEIDDNQKVLQK